MHTLVCLDCSFTRRDTLVDEAENIKYLTETTGVFPRKSMRNRRSLEALNKF